MRSGGGSGVKILKSGVLDWLWHTPLIIRFSETFWRNLGKITFRNLFVTPIYALKRTTLKSALLLGHSLTFPFVFLVTLFHKPFLSPYSLLFSPFVSHSCVFSPIVSSFLFPPRSRHWVFLFALSVSTCVREISDLKAWDGLQAGRHTQALIRPAY